MRINLVTPFAEKDAAKALGARWDSTRKLWYITGVSDLTPFARWLPDLDARAGVANGTAASQPGRTGRVAAQQSGGAVSTQAKVEVPHCGCDVLPWEDCVHTKKPDLRD